MLINFLILFYRFFFAFLFFLSLISVDKVANNKGSSPNLINKMRKDYNLHCTCKEKEKYHSFRYFLVFYSEFTEFNQQNEERHAKRNINPFPSWQISLLKILLGILYLVKQFVQWQFQNNNFKESLNQEYFNFWCLVL